jgi:polyisoprenoid-binding protein YceI
LAATLALAPGPSPAGTYDVDGEHTSVTFRVRHLLTYVEGRFGTFEGSIDFDPAAPTTAKVKGSIDVASIDTNVKERDEHLRSADFFAAAEHPKITFESTTVSDVDAEAKRGKIHGNLTIRGVTKPVTLDVTLLGRAANPWSGAETLGFSATAKINREDFGLTWNQTLETGGVLVGKEITLSLDVEAVAVSETASV